MPIDTPTPDGPVEGCGEKGGHALLQDEEQADEGGPSSVQS